jgi:Pyruvate/2-oxoacid:ferredoxin oxidoreductase gamma subunit
MPSLIAEASRVNDFVVKFANVNGTGSASANSLIMKAIFRMGVPVTGKNYFPSNIQGLPTWYEIRVTRDGYAARASHVDIMVAMNAETYSKDVRELRSGGYLIYDSTWPRSALLQRGDITVIPVPLAKLVNENFDGVRNRILLKNIAEIARFKHQGSAARVRLRQGTIDFAAAAARRAHGEDPRPYHDGWQYRGRLGLCLCGRDRGCVVSDHALDVVDGRLQRLLRALSRRS